MKKKFVMTVAGLMLAGGFAFGPAMAAEDGDGSADASAECSDGAGHGNTVHAEGVLATSGDPQDGEGNLYVCVTQTDGNADGAAVIGGNANDGEGWIVADGDGDNRDETKGYIGIEGGTGGVTPVSDGEDCKYTGGDGTPTDPEGLPGFVMGEPGDGEC